MTKYTAGPHTPPLAHVDVHSVIHAQLCCIKISVLQTTIYNERGGGAGEGVDEMCESKHSYSF
jgi:hypothetical protein